MKGNLRTLAFVLVGATIGGFSLSSAQDALSEERIRAELYEVMEHCWGTVSDLPEPERLTVVVRAELDRGGRLLSDPVVVSPQEVADYDEDMKSALGRALRAVRVCVPYSTLPIEHYEIWRTVTFRFRHEPEDKGRDAKG